MKIVSWNINSVRKRQPLLLEFIQEYQPDIICLQEIKCQNEQFISDVYLDVGYNSYVHGQKAYNGVAILSKSVLSDVETALVNYEYAESRFMQASMNDMCVINVYITNGQMQGSPAYYKQLNFLDSLIITVQKAMQDYKHVIVCGDFNIAPLDIHADFALRSSFICDAQLRQKWQQLVNLGLKDSLSDKYTWYDYRYKNVGARIDNLLYTPSLNLIETTVIDKYRFEVESPSDHLPIMLCCEVR